MIGDIKVLGTGCLRCQTLYENVIKALEELNLSYPVEKIQDLSQIAAHGVFSPPGLIINEKLISQGKILSVEEIKKILMAFL